MRILIGTDNFYPNVNGAARFSYEFTKGLVKLGHEVSVIAPSTKFKDLVSKHKGMTIYGVRSVMIPKIIHPSGMRVPLTINSKQVKKWVEEIKPDVIHIQDHFMIGYQISKVGRKMGIPIVGTNHFMPENFIHYLYPPDFAKKPLSKLAWRQFINVYKNLDLITTPTETAANLIRNLGLKKNIISISCGIDLNRFNSKSQGDYLRKRFKITSSKPVVLFVGRLDKEKKLDQVIRAFTNVLKSEDAQLVIAGKGKEKSNLVKLSQKLGIEENVSFTGFVSDKDLPSLYHCADLFVIASIAELQSLATMEAMASGLPVVAAKVMALPELVHNGKNGYLFNEADTKTLGEKIIKILKNPALKKKMSKNSLSIIKNHNIEKTLKKYVQIYQQLLPENNS